MNSNTISDETTPTQFFLSQNYPNPFKEKTVMKYCVPIKTKVHIAIYNTQGEMLKVLVNEIKNPGTYEIKIILAKQPAKSELRLADGYYFYKMVTEEFSSEKKWFCINHLCGRFTMKNLIQFLFFFLLTTQICFAQWVQVGLSGQSIKDIAIKDATIFAITSDSGKVLRSIDNGINWTIIADSCGRDIEISQTGKVFMVIDTFLYHNWFNTNSLLSSMEDGVTWSQVNIVEQIQDSIPSDIGWVVCDRITISPTGRIFCNIGLVQSRWFYQDIIALSDDDGITWSTPGIGICAGKLFDFRNQDLITIGLYSARYGGTYEHINLSNDDGNTWDYLGWAQGYSGREMPDAKVIGFFSNDNIITGGIGYDSSGFPTIPEIMMSTDMCSTWTKISSLNSQVGVSWSSGSTEGMLISTDSLGLFLFSDEGDSLGSRNEGLANLNVHSLILDNNGYVYAGTGNGVWRRPLSEIVTSVEDATTQPAEFILQQNYPNPFNPITAISWQLAESSEATLKVYNILGREIATLVDEYKPAGKYEVEFSTKGGSDSGGNAVNLPSGVYFYQLRAGSFVETKKMILLK